MEGGEGKIDISSFRDHPIHEAVAPIIWLHGTWRTENGIGTVRNNTTFTYGEEIKFTSVGEPGLSVSCFSWNAEKNVPMHQETGFLRIQPGTSNVAMIVAQNFGLAVIEEGEVCEQTLTLFSKAVCRTSFSRGSPVIGTKRVFQLKNDNELEQVFYMETPDTPLLEHLRATYRKVD